MAEAFCRIRVRIAEGIGSPFYNLILETEDISTLGVFGFSVTIQSMVHEAQLEETVQLWKSRLANFREEPMEVILGRKE